MTENKRFKYYEHKGADYILENPNEDLDFIEMLGDCLEAEEIVNKLNELAEENERLKQENQSWLKTASHVDNIAHKDKDYAKRMHKDNEELKQFKENVFKVIDKKIEWHLLQAKKCRNQGDIKKAIKFEEAIMTLNILRRDIEKLKELEE